MTERYKSQVNTFDQLKNHYVVILTTKRFFGYDESQKSNKEPYGKLREYAYDEVKQIVLDTFQNNVFIDSVITANTTLLIVPDDWDRALPQSAKRYSQNLMYIPFSYVLHPKAITPNEIAHFTAPHDAPYRILEKEQKTQPPKDAFFLDKVTPDALSKRWQGWKYSNNTRPIVPGFAASTPDLNAENDHPWHAFTPSLDAEMDKMDKQVSEMNMKVAKARSSVQTTAGKVDTLNTKVKNVQSDIGQTKASMEDSATKLKNMKADLAQMKGATHTSAVHTHTRSKSVDRQRTLPHKRSDSKNHKMHGANVHMTTKEENEEEEDERAYKKAWDALLKRSEQTK